MICSFGRAGLLAANPFQKLKYGCQEPLRKMLRKTFLFNVPGQDLRYIWLFHFLSFEFTIIFKLPLVIFLVHFFCVIKNPLRYFKSFFIASTPSKCPSAISSGLTTKSKILCLSIEKFHIDTGSSFFYFS